MGAQFVDGVHLGATWLAWGWWGGLGMGVVVLAVRVWFVVASRA